MLAKHTVKDFIKRLPVTLLPKKMHMRNLHYLIKNSVIKIDRLPHHHYPKSGLRVANRMVSAA